MALESANIPTLLLLLYQFTGDERWLRPPFTPVKSRWDDNDSGGLLPAMQQEPAGRPLRVIATSWSDNPRKGADVLAWLDRRLEEDLDVIFAGRTNAQFERIRVVGPLPSGELADLLRSRDVYLAASRDDPCSNALLEGLACGLPAAYLRSGGHPELVGDGGIGFDDPEELPGVLQRLRNEHAARRAAIRVPSLAEVTDRYLEVLRG